MNPTILGYRLARETMDALGFGYVSFGDLHFREDLQFKDAVPMIKRLLAVAETAGFSFGVKLTNTLPVDNPGDIMSGDEMYMSGRSLFPLTAKTAALLSKEFGGTLRISWSGGADLTNIKDLFNAGIRPVTMATALLKPGGYNRFRQIAETFAGMGYSGSEGVDLEMLDSLVSRSETDKWYRKPIKHRDTFAKEDKLPLTDCFTAPCSDGCPIHQDVQEYLSLAGEKKYGEALEVILDKNPLPFITGTICTHRCMTACTRNHYEDPIMIRDVKLMAAREGFKAVIGKIGPAEKMTGSKAAVIGGGPAGLAVAYFLQRYGICATIFEREKEPGGVVRQAIPDFRIGTDAIERDIEIIKKTGVEFVLGTAVSSVDELREKGYKYIVMATGAPKHGELGIESENKINALDFLASYKRAKNIDLGQSAAVGRRSNTGWTLPQPGGSKSQDGEHRIPQDSLVHACGRRGTQAGYRRRVIFRELLQPISHRDKTLLCSVMTLGAPTHRTQVTGTDSGDRKHPGRYDH